MTYLNGTVVGRAARYDIALVVGGLRPSLLEQNVATRNATSSSSSNVNKFKIINIKSHIKLSV